MPDKRRYIYWDSCVFIDYLNVTDDRITAIESVLAEVENSQDTRIITSTLTITEVAYATVNGRRRLSDEDEQAIDTMWADYSIFELVEFHRAIAFKARRFIREAVANGLHLSGPDAIHLASARLHDAYEFHTYDRKLYGFSEMVGVRICQPYTPQLRLPYT